MNSEAAPETSKLVRGSPAPGRTVSGPWLDENKRAYAALLLLTLGALYAAYLIYRPFLKSLFLALVLTIAFAPVHDWVSRRVRGRTLAALVTTLAVVLVIAVPLLLLSRSLVSQAASLYGFLSQQVSGPWSGHLAWANDAVQRLAEQTGLPPQQIKSTITSRAQELGGWLVAMAGWAARAFMQQVGTAILTFLILFFFLRDRDHYVHATLNTLPLPPGRSRQLASTLHETVVGNLYGMVAVALIQGSLIAIGWWVLGLRAPLFWAAVAGIFSFVPLVGPSLVWWPGVFFLAIQGRWIAAIVLLVWGAVVVSSVDYIVRPRFAAKGANANTLLVLLSILGGLRVFGAIGIIAGPVVLSAVSALLSMIREERQVALDGDAREQNIAA